MKISNLLLVGVLLIFILISGALVCKHISKKVDKIEPDVVNLKVKENKKSGAINGNVKLQQELFRKHIHEMHEYNALRFGHAGKPVVDLDTPDKTKDKIFIQVMCIDGFKWVMFAAIYNGKAVLDVEQMMGYDGPVSCY